MKPLILDIRVDKPKWLEDLIIDPDFMSDSFVI